MPELDINASANEVVELLNQHRAREAATRLEALRQDQAPVVREALDRYVADRGSDRLNALRQPNGVLTADAAAVSPMLDRLASATAAPRFPAERETEHLSQAQQYDIYASVITMRGTQAARDALQSEDRVILGMRQENPTIAGTDRQTRMPSPNGSGVYDDRLVVVWKDADGLRHAREFNHVTTEPTAQYDAHATTNPVTYGYERVAARRTEGEDVNRDQTADLGRLSEGTTEMLATTHPRRAHPDEFSLRPSPEAVRTGARRVERDSNGDGWFDSRDVNGVQDLNNTFKIHRGSSLNTDSAGCQTIRGSDYDDFVQSVRGTPGQDRWQYVLTSTGPAQSREFEHDSSRGLDHNRPAASDPRNPGHPDHPLQEQISTHLNAMGGRYAEHADPYSLSLLYEAKANNMTRIDHVATSNATGTRTEGATIFLVQGRLGDPAALRIPVSAAEVRDMTPEQSLERLSQQQANQGPQLGGQAAHVQPDAGLQQAPAMRGP